MREIFLTALLGLALVLLVGCGGGSGSTSGGSGEPFYGVCEFETYFVGLEAKSPDALDECFEIQNEFKSCVRADEADIAFCGREGYDSFTLCSNVAGFGLAACRNTVLADEADCIASATDHYGDPASCTYIGFKRCDKAFAVEQEVCLNNADYVEQDCLVATTGDDSNATLDCFDDVIRDRTACFQRAAFSHNVSGSDDCDAVANSH